MPGKLTLTICEFMKSSQVLYGEYILSNTGIHVCCTSGYTQHGFSAKTKFCCIEFNSIVCFFVNAFYIVFILEIGDGYCQEND